MSSKKKETGVGFNKPLGGDCVLQIPGMSDMSIKAIREKCAAALGSDPALCEAKARVNAIDVYVKPDEGKAYYVAKTSIGESTGSVDLA